MRRVCTLAGLDDAGGMLPVTIGPRDVLVVRDGDAVRAVDRACPHEGFPLDEGQVARGVLTCPAHGWRFALETGACLGVGEDLRTYRVHVDGEDVLVDDDAEVTPRERELAVEALLGALELGRPALAARRAARLRALGVDDRALATLLARYGGSHAGAGLDPEVAVIADVLAGGDTGAWPATAAGIAEQLARMPPRFGPEPATPLAWAEQGVAATLGDLVDDEDAEEADRTVAGMLASGVPPAAVVAGLAAGVTRRFRGLWPLVVLERAARLADLDPAVARAVLPAAAHGCAAGQGRSLPDLPVPDDALVACASTLAAVEEPAGCALGCALALVHARAADWAVSVAGPDARPALAHAVAASRLFGPATGTLSGESSALPPIRAETARGYAVCQAAAHVARTSSHAGVVGAVAGFLGRPRRERFIEDALVNPVYELL
jgi:nitrite reductase/ring-hydroxylating ferredoxin subunit